jgi:outer membrane protein OmpA-like peptidoglycan-associated protein
MSLPKKLLAGACFICLAMSGCKSLMNSQRGAVLGSAGGGAIGAIIGNAAGNSELGAIMGASVGGVTGEVIGKKMDTQANEMRIEVPDARVERIGEGIVVEFKSKILFSAGAAELSPSSRKNISQLAKVLNKYPDTNIEVRGHTDDRGKESYNQALSDKRANAVASYLQTMGITSGRITTKGFGESMPKYTNTSETGRSENRRVEFIVSANEKMKEEAGKEAVR